MLRFVPSPLVLHLYLNNLFHLLLNLRHNFRHTRSSRSPPLSLPLLNVGKFNGLVDPDFRVKTH